MDAYVSREGSAWPVQARPTAGRRSMRLSIIDLLTQTNHSEPEIDRARERPHHPHRRRSRRRCLRRCPRPSYERERPHHHLRARLVRVLRQLRSALLPRRRDHRPRGPAHRQDLAVLASLRHRGAHAPRGDRHRARGQDRHGGGPRRRRVLRDGLRQAHPRARCRPVRAHVAGRGCRGRLQPAQSRGHRPHRRGHARRPARGRGRGSRARGSSSWGSRCSAAAWRPPRGA